MVSVPVLALLLAAALPEGGTLRIDVTDATTGQPVAGAIVVLADVSRTGITDGGGRYVFTDVAPGPQHLAVRRLGYAPRVLHAFVGEGRTLDLTIALSPLPARLAGVRVESSPVVQLRDQQADDVHVGDRALTLAAIKNHPSLAEPDGLLAVTGGHVSARPESPSGLNVLGGSTDHLAYLIDEIPVLSPYHIGGAFGALNPDALDRVELRVSPGTTALADALSGVLSASTRTAPARAQVTGGLSVTQSRLTFEAPLPIQGAGLLLSGRLLFPGLVGQKREPAHIDGDGTDGLARVVAPLGGGTLRLLATDARSDIALATRVPETDNSAPPPRNDLHWSSTSVGAHWERRGDSGSTALTMWRAQGRADATWPVDSATSMLSSSFIDLGFRARVRRGTPTASWGLAFRANRRSGEYRASRSAASSAGVSLGNRGLLLTIQPDWTRTLFGAHRLSLGTSGSAYRGRAYAAPFAEWTWTPRPSVALAGSVSRRLQFSQSARNAESVVGNVFPADLPVNAGASVPVARADHVSILTEWRPSRARLLGARAWSRRLNGLALPAVGTGGPYVTGGLATGRGRARGLSVDATTAHARWGVVANYSWQEVRLTAADTTWQPEHGTTQTVDAGLIVFPEPSASVRLGLTVGTGRRVSGFGGRFEWEACNLRDRGCEFAGGPLSRDEALGGIGLPRYARLDVGGRKHWHLRAAGRDVVLSAFATWSNILDTRNVFTYVRDPATGVRQRIAMRPSAPVVIGFDWSF